MFTGDYCRENPVTAAPSDSLRDVAKRMDAASVGCVVVVDQDAQPVGIVTDRDLVIGVLRGRWNADTVMVGEIMEGSPITVSEGVTVGVAMVFMRRHGLRRLPVVDEEGRLTGILSADDLIQLLARDLSDVAETVRFQFPTDLAGQEAIGTGIHGGPSHA